MEGLRGACPPGASPTIERLFGDCVASGRDLCGFLLGLFSIACWMVAQVPQLVKNHRTRSVEALSPWFLAEWLLGDSASLVGALLTGDQPPSVVASAQYFVCVDAVSLVQYVYLTAARRRAERAGAGAPRRRAHHHHHGHRGHRGAAAGDGGGEGGGGGAAAGDAGGGRLRRAVPAAAAAAALALAQLAGAARLGGGLAPAPRRRLLSAAGVEGGLSPSGGGGGGGAAAATALEGALPGWAHGAGRSLGFASAALYLGSRVSQIAKNAARRSADGLALSMFGCAVVANCAYGGAILLRARSGADVAASAPWLLGSLGTVFLDAVILAQARWYAPKRRGAGGGGGAPLLPGGAGGGGAPPGGEDA